MTAGHLVTLGDLPSLSYPKPDQLVDTGRQLIFVGPAQYLDVDDLTLLSVRDSERGVLNVTRLLTEYGPEKLLLGAELSLALGRDLADQDVAGTYLGPDTNNALLVQIT